MNSDKIREEIRASKKQQVIDKEISTAVADSFLGAEVKMNEHPPLFLRVNIVRDIFMAGYNLALQHSKGTDNNA